MPKLELPSRLALAAVQQGANNFEYKGGSWVLPTMQINWLGHLLAGNITVPVNHCGFAKEDGIACPWTPGANRTPTNVDLGRHELTHCQGGYQCTLGCTNKFFKQKSQLDTHVRTMMHKNEKPFRCIECSDVEYSDLSSFARHKKEMMNRNNGRPHKWYDARRTTLEEARKHEGDPQRRKARKNCARQNASSGFQPNPQSQLGGPGNLQLFNMQWTSQTSPGGTDNFAQNAYAPIQQQESQQHGTDRPFFEPFGSIDDFAQNAPATVQQQGWQQFELDSALPMSLDTRNDSVALDGDDEFARGIAGSGSGLQNVQNFNNNFLANGTFTPGHLEGAAVLGNSERFDNANAPSNLGQPDDGNFLSDVDFDLWLNLGQFNDGIDPGNF